METASSYRRVGEGAKAVQGGICVQETLIHGKSRINIYNLSKRWGQGMSRVAAWKYS